MWINIVYFFYHINLNLEPMNKTLLLSLILAVYVNSAILPFDNTAV